MSLAPFPHQTRTPTKLRYDEHTGEPLYPHAPDEYEQLHIVGHRLENGEYLPVKVFIRDNLGVGDARLKMHEKVWRQWVLIAGLAGVTAKYIQVFCAIRYIHHDTGRCL